MPTNKPSDSHVGRTSIGRDQRAIDSISHAELCFLDGDDRVLFGVPPERGSQDLPCVRSEPKLREEGRFMLSTGVRVRKQVPRNLVLRHNSVLKIWQFLEHVNILGIGGHSHDSATALICDGQLIAAVAMGDYTLVKAPRG